MAKHLSDFFMLVTLVPSLGCMRAICNLKCVTQLKDVAVAEDYADNY